MFSPTARPRRGKATAFTLLELMVSTAIVALLSVILFSVISKTSDVWRTTSGKIKQFREARDGFEAMTRRISQATLNTYWDYDDPVQPSKYERQSELRFLSGPAGNILGTTAAQNPTHAIFFQAPLGFVSGADYKGLQNLLNTWGYFLEYNSDKPSLPPPVAAAPNAPLERWRFRLIELMQPSDQITLYNHTSGAPAYDGKDWFTEALQQPSPPVHVLAENIIALVILPQLSPKDETVITGQPATGAALAPSYAYDSTKSHATAALNPKNQLPPVLQLAMVSIDEESAKRIGDSGHQEIANELSTKFLNADQFDSDLSRLEEFLVGRNIKYRIFNTAVSLKGAKWSRAQVN